MRDSGMSKKSFKGELNNEDQVAVRWFVLVQDYRNPPLIRAAPEVLYNHEYTRQSDTYSFGDFPLLQDHGTPTFQP